MCCPQYSRGYVKTVKTGTTIEIWVLPTILKGQEKVGTTIKRWVLPPILKGL